MAAKLPLLLSEFLLNLAHLSANTLIRIHLHTLPQEPSTKDKEQHRGGEAGEVSRDQGGDGLSEEGRQYGHDEEGAEGGGEDGHAVVLHGHEGGDEEGLVADLRDEDHGQGEDEGVEGLDYAVVFVYARDVAGGEGAVAAGDVVVMRGVGISARRVWEVT